jgi:hypothetical protein
MLVLALGLAGRPAAGQVLLMPEDLPPPVYPVGAIELVYAEPHPDQPPLDALLPVEVELRETERGWAAPLAGEPTERIPVGGAASPTLRLARSSRRSTTRRVCTASTCVHRPPRSIPSPSRTCDPKAAARSASR